MSTSEIIYVVIAVAVVLVLIALAVAAARRRRSAQLRTTFGPEYERAVAASGDRDAAERDLSGRVNRRRGFNIVPLTREAQLRYAAEWRQVQQDFVDSPRQAVVQADALVIRLMTDRGYPMNEFEQRAADVSVDHPQVVENYRSAHAISTASDPSTADTEQLRQAMTYYRALFQELLVVDQPSAHPEKEAAGSGDQMVAGPEGARR
ncbi:MAG: hypothetical protein WCB85_00840 [Candidatus Dormiibacterota bacterium]